MIKFTKKALSLAIASFVTMTSVFGSSNFAKAETTTDATEVASIATSSTKTHLSATFDVPANWGRNIYAYAYYVEAGKTIEPLGCWPGKELTKDTDGKYNVKFESSVGWAKVILADMETLGKKEKDTVNNKEYYNGKVLHQAPTEDNDPTSEDGYLIYATEDGRPTIINPVSISFKAPAEWDNVYAYAYYTDYNNNLQEPLGYWPGTKLNDEADGVKDGKYDASIISEVGEAKFIFTNVDESALPDGKMPEPLRKNDGIEGYYYPVTAKAQLPELSKDEKSEDRKSKEDGYKASEGNNSFSSENVPTPGPITTVKPTIVPTITPSVTPTVTPVITATVTPSAVPTVTPVVTATVTPSAIPTVTPVITATVAPSAIPTITPTVEPTIIPTVTPTITPVVVPTVEPTVVPSVEPVIIPTVTPSAVPTVEPTAIPTVVPTVIPTIVPTVTPTAIPTVTPTAVPTVTPDVIPDNPVPNDPIKDATTLKGSISFDKTTKTVGETIKIKVSAKNGKPAYKYTYTVKKGNKKVLSVANTKSKSVNWIPDKAGTYTVSVKITDAKKKSVTVTKKYKVQSAVITIKSFKTNKSSNQKVKTKIVISANATAKKGKASYKFAVKLGNGKIKTIKGFSSKNKVTWKPTKKGTYTLYVYVKNGKGITVSKTKTFKIKK
ncbi:MAG: starch-binding protein [Lachnospiraceae bacterium]|nr:starch-binding protein [Lachnospiraceae bacterium]